VSCATYNVEFLVLFAVDLDLFGREVLVARPATYVGVEVVEVDDDIVLEALVWLRVAERVRVGQVAYLQVRLAERRAQMGLAVDCVLGICAASYEAGLQLVEQGGLAHLHDKHQRVRIGDEATVCGPGCGCVAAVDVMVARRSDQCERVGLAIASPVKLVGREAVLASSVQQAPLLLLEIEHSEQARLGLFIACDIRRLE
jgi:hypothetical protein